MKHTIPTFLLLFLLSFAAGASAGSEPRGLIKVCVPPRACTLTLPDGRQVCVRCDKDRKPCPSPQPGPQEGCYPCLGMCTPDKPCT